MGVIKRQGIKNTIITYVGLLIGAISIIFIQPKLLDENELGLTRLMYNFSYMVGLLVPFGVGNIIVKYLPAFRNKDNGHHGFAGFVLLVFFIGFILCASVLLIFKDVITGYYAERSSLFVRYFLYVIPFIFIVSAITVTTVYCQALFKSTIPSFLNDVFIKVGLIFIIALYHWKYVSFEVFVYLFIGLYLIELLVLVAYILLIDKVSLKIDFARIKREGLGRMLRFGLYLCFASFAAMAIRTFDSVILGQYSLGAVAVYTTAFYIASFIEVPLGALDRISHTKIADYFAKGSYNEIEKVYKDSVKYLLVTGGLLFLGINTCAKYIYETGGLPAIYSECIGVVYIVSLGAFVNISTGINSAIIFYSKYYVFGTLLLVVTFAITAALNIILIPLYGVYGAAIASLSGAVISNLAKYFFIFFKFRFQPYTSKSGYLLLVILACFTGSVFLPEISTHPLVNILYKGGIVSVAYIFIVYRMKIVPELFDMVLSRIRSIRN